MISVVIPLYNKAGSITAAIESVLAQSMPDFELIVVDDGSTDGSELVAEAVADPRVRLLRQRNSGVSVARNAGIAAARYEYVAFLDADDEWKDDFLARITNLINAFPEAHVFATSYIFHFRNNRLELPKICVEEGFRGIIGDYFRRVSMGAPLLWTSALCVRKESLLACGGFPPGVTLGEDLITWARLACSGAIAFDSAVCAVYNFRDAEQLVFPRRAPDRTDYVGAELKRLNDDHPDPYLRRYAALWQKMRLTTFVRLGMRREVWQEFGKIWHYGFPDKKVWAWWLLSCLPFAVTRKILLLHAGRMVRKNEHR